MEKELFDHIHWVERYLRENRYRKTSKLIVSLEREVKKENCEQVEFVERLGPLFCVFGEEFETIAPIGQSYRKRCFEEVSVVVLKALGNENDTKSELSAETDCFLDRMHEMKKSIDPTMELCWTLYGKPDRSNPEGFLMFQSACQIYLITVEGVFDEVVKILHRFIEAPTDGKGRPENFKGANVWKILRVCKQVFGIDPVFLENWQEKNDIRNAIAHAQAQYCPEQNKIHFFSEDSVSKRIYDRTMSIKEFLAIQLELIDAIDCFYYAIMLFDMVRLLTLAFASHSGNIGSGRTRASTREKTLSFS